MPVSLQTELVSFRVQAGDGGPPRLEGVGVARVFPLRCPRPWEAPTPPIGHTTFLLLLLRGWSVEGPCPGGVLCPGGVDKPVGMEGTDGYPHPGSPGELKALPPFAQCGVLFQGATLAQSRAEQGKAVSLQRVWSLKWFLPSSSRQLDEVLWFAGLPRYAGFTCSMSARPFLMCRLRVLPSPSAQPRDRSTPVTVDRDAGVPAHQPLPLWPGSGTPLLRVLRGDGGRAAWLVPLPEVRSWPSRECGSFWPRGYIWGHSPGGTTWSSGPFLSEPGLLCHEVGRRLGSSALGVSWPRGGSGCCPASCAGSPGVAGTPPHCPQNLLASVIPAG